MSELYVGLVEKDAALHQAMLEHPAFGRSDHALFANTPGFPKERAARIFLERWAQDGNFALTGNIVQLFDGSARPNRGEQRLGDGPRRVPVQNVDLDAHFPLGLSLEPGNRGGSRILPNCGV